ncbi:hypothetical protein SCMU_14160 [Sinomonas cyclohexanicum]|uniref:Uncharacterized protein n=2 Tax=Sinomonas cyclohexanicum TaxID=322009 RepID=A0ABN6FG03_SINCY|nr:hypothetical protein SCMU_14160 [Corynebacterium cyclohexanicum]
MIGAGWTVWVCPVCWVWESHPDHGAALAQATAHMEGTGHEAVLRSPQWVTAEEADQQRKARAEARAAEVWG